MRTLAKAAARYQERFNEFPDSLQSLANTEEDHLREYGLDSVFTGDKASYHILYEAPISAAGKRDRFFARAIPCGYNEGAPEFCVDQTAVIRYSRQGTACAADSTPVPIKYGAPSRPEH